MARRLDRALESNDKYLHRLYTDPKSPAAFSSVDRLYRYAKEKGDRTISRKQVKRWLEKQPIYTSNRKVVRKFARRPIVTPYLQYMYEADNSYMDYYGKYNRGYKYFLLMIDAFSKYAYTRALKKLDGKHVTAAVKSIFNASKKIPEHLRTDKGRDFRNATLDKYLRKKGVNHILTHNETQASIAERAISSIKSRLLKYMIQHKTKKWIDVLQDVTSGYNAAYHRSIRMRPKDVKKADERAVWKSLYYPKARKRGSSQTKHRSNPYRFKAGDIVSIASSRQGFARGYDKKWTDEYFTVADRKLRQGVPVYTIEDQKKKAILGTFYNDELQKVNPQPDQTYQIERILKRRTRNRKKEALVRWVGWNKDFDSWIPVKDIQAYK